MHVFEKKENRHLRMFNMYFYEKEIISIFFLTIGNFKVSRQILRIQSCDYPINNVTKKGVKEQTMI